MIRLCRAGCGNPLTGKRRLYCSDKCRKRFSRAADKTDRNQASRGNGDVPENIFALFTSELSGADDATVRQLKLNLLEHAKGFDMWMNRAMSRPNMYPDGTLQACQILERIFTRMTDDLDLLQGGER